jgi:hypothetical protein
VIKYVGHAVPIGVWAGRCWRPGAERIGVGAHEVRAFDRVNQAIPVGVRVAGVRIVADAAHQESLDFGVVSNAIMVGVYFPWKCAQVKRLGAIAEAVVICVGIVWIGADRTG